MENYYQSKKIRFFCRIANNGRNKLRDWNLLGKEEEMKKRWKEYFRDALNSREGDMY